MKHLLIIAAVALVTLGACKKDHLTANGDRITETRVLSAFSTLSTSGSNQVHVNYGNEYKVTLKGSGNLLSYFETTIHGDNLELGYKNASINLDDIEVFVTMPQIKGASISGSGSIRLYDSFPSIDEFKLAISGSGDAEVSSPLTIDKMQIKVSGSGKAFFQQALTKEATIDISGSGDAHLQVSDYLKATISGSGKLFYKGNPRLDSKISGSGKLTKF